MKHITSMLDTVELTHNFSKLNRLANNAEVRSLLKFLFIWYYRMFPFEIKSNFRNWPTINIFLSFVDEHLANYYRYYRRYAPKVDIRIVIAVSLTIISAIQVHMHMNTCIQKNLYYHLCNKFPCVIQFRFSSPIWPLFYLCFLLFNPTPCQFRHKKFSPSAFWIGHVLHDIVVVVMILDYKIHCCQEQAFIVIETWLLYACVTYRSAFTTNIRLVLAPKLWENYVTQK